MDREGRRSLRKYGFAILFILLIPFLLFLITLLVFFMNRGETIRESSVIEGSEWLMEEKARMVGSGEAIEYYDNVEDSLREGYWNGTGKKMPEWEQIISFQEENYLFVLFIGELKGVQKIPTIYQALFNVVDGKISNPLYYWTTGVKASLFSFGDIYYEEDRIAKDIDNSYYNTDITNLANNAIPIYYGVGIEPKTKQLTILGESPTEVIPFKCQDETYYLWYYLDSERFGTIYEENIDPSVTTMAEMIEIFDIRFDGAIP